MKNYLVKYFPVAKKIELGSSVYSTNHERVIIVDEIRNYITDNEPYVFSKSVERNLPFSKCVPVELCLMHRNFKFGDMVLLEPNALDLEIRGIRFFTTGVDNKEQLLDFVYTAHPTRKDLIGNSRRAWPMRSGYCYLGRISHNANVADGSEIAPEFVREMLYDSEEDEWIDPTSTERALLVALQQNLPDRYIWKYQIKTFLHDGEFI